MKKLLIISTIFFMISFDVFAQFEEKENLSSSVKVRKIRPNSKLPLEFQRSLQHSQQITDYKIRIERERKQRYHRSDQFFLNDYDRNLKLVMSALKVPFLPHWSITPSQFNKKLGKENSKEDIKRRLMYVKDQNALFKVKNDQAFNMKMKNYWENYQRFYQNQKLMDTLCVPSHLQKRQLKFCQNQLRLISKP